MRVRKQVLLSQSQSQSSVGKDPGMHGLTTGNCSFTLLKKNDQIHICCIMIITGVVSRSL